MTWPDACTAIDLYLDPDLKHSLRQEGFDSEEITLYTRGQVNILCDTVSHACG